MKSCLIKTEAKSSNEGREFYLFIMQFYLFRGNSWSFLTLSGDFAIYLKYADLILQLGIIPHDLWRWIFLQCKRSKPMLKIRLSTRKMVVREKGKARVSDKGLVWSKYEQGGERDAGATEKRGGKLWVQPHPVCARKEIKNQKKTGLFHLHFVSFCLFELLENRVFSRNGLLLLKTRSFMTLLAMVKSYKWGWKG